MAAMAVLALAACDKAKPRDLPPDPFATPPAPEGPVAPPSEGLSAGLPKRPEPATAFLDRVGQAVDPLGKPPAVTAAGVATVVEGFGFDALAKAPARGMDVVIDEKAYGTAYGGARPDVAAYFKNPALGPVGFRVVLPPEALAPGQHLARLRVVAVDGKGYFESRPVAFEVK
jgi:hypothetical protein